MTPTTRTAFLYPAWYRHVRHSFEHGGLILHQALDAWDRFETQFHLVPIGSSRLAVTFNDIDLIGVNEPEVNAPRLPGAFPPPDSPLLSLTPQGLGVQWSEHAFAWQDSPRPGVRAITFAFQEESGRAISIKLLPLEEYLTTAAAYYLAEMTSDRLANERRRIAALAANDKYRWYRHLGIPVD